MAGGCSSPPRAVTYGDCSQLTVFAASSLTTVFPKVANTLQPGCANSIRFQFAGTDALAAQLEQGARADVFAGASATFDEELVSKRLIDQPRFFATNRLVVVVPPSNPGAIRSIGDLAKPGLKLVIGGPTVPVGAYTRKVLASLDAVYGSGFSGRVLANVVSNEDSVSNVMAKVQLGEADAGFVYVTDARAAAGKVATIELPAEAQAIA